jgi:hypothetical protein
MPPRKIFFIACLIASVLLLAAGHVITRQWIWSLLTVLLIPAWLFARNHYTPWLPPVCLLASIGLAIIGKLNGAPSLLMIFGSGISLAVWDLLLLDIEMGKNSSEQTHQYEIKHLQSLILALGFGLVAASLGRLLNLRVPFLILLLLVLLTVFGVDRVLGYIKKAGR